MKTTSDHHREALDQALRIALGTSQPALRRQALTRAASHLIHPRLVLESPLLTDAHPWRREALVVSDALEAVTNGMEEPGVIEALTSLDPESPFLEWRELVLAIHFFYEGLDEAVEAHLAAIGTSSPLQAVVQALRSLVAGDQRLSGPPLRLAKQVAQPNPLVQQCIQDIAEGLEANDEDLFWTSLTDWLDQVATAQPERARSAVLWAWNQLEWREFDEAVLLDLGTSLWGAAESYRLAALGTLPWDAEGAALLWFRFLVLATREGCGRHTLEEGRSWLERFREAALSTGGFSEASLQVWQNLTAALDAELSARGWNDSRVAPPRSEAPRSVATPPPAHGQLDLFA